MIARHDDARPLRLLACLAWLGLAGVAAAQEARPRAQPLPEGVKAHRDLAYVDDGHPRQKLDLYLPEEGEGSWPLILWIHGGGWQAGSKDGCPPLRDGFPGRGFAIASLDYRLSGDAPFPAQVEDCKAAVRWLRTHAGEYGLDPDRFAAWGSSAGGHLVALLGTSGDVDGFDVGPNPDASSRVQAVCDYYGPTDLLVFVATPGYESHARPTSPESKLLGGAVAEVADKARRANPITYVSEDDPPFLIVHGSADPTVPPNQSELLHEALSKAGVPSTLRILKGARHGGPEFNAPKVREMVEAFFEAHLEPAKPAPEAGSGR